MVTTADDKILRTASWTVRRPRGTVVILPGRGDYIERYFETINDFREMKFAVACCDFRGQGGSQRFFRNPYRSSIADFDRYEQDIIAFVKSVVLPDCPPPYFLLGHSTGALIGLRLLRRYTWFEKAVFTSPLLGLRTAPWPWVVARFLARTVPLLGGSAMFLPGYAHRPLVLSGFEGNPFSSDRQRFMRDVSILNEQPALGLGGPTFGWLKAAWRAMDEIHELNAGQRLKAPVLIVAAGRDRVVDTEATRRFASHMAGISLVVIPDAMHEILMERDPIRAQFFAAFAAFAAFAGDG